MLLQRQGDMIVSTQSSAKKASSPTNPETKFSLTKNEAFLACLNKSGYVQGRADDGTKIHGTLRPKHEGKPSPFVIGIQGTWYDITKFAPYHPGGDILYEFYQKDATAQFLAYHDVKILQQRFKLSTCGSYDFYEDEPGGSKLQGAWMKLNAKFEREGRYTTPLYFLWSRIAILVIAFVALFAMIHLYNQTQSGVAFLAGAVCMCGIWQQSGFLMHDAMHNHILCNRKGNQLLGFIFGNVLFGVSGKWWRDEHNEHHIFPNTLIEGAGPSDPQMVEDVWIQAEQLIPFFDQSTVKFILEYQAYYLVPIPLIVGLLCIKVDAILHTGRYIADICGLAMHMVWVGGALWLLPGAKERIVFYVIANFASGCLVIQLLVSHLAKPWKEKEDTKQPGSWAERQVEAVLDITCPPWLDWFHGGLHIHSVHHLFPRMCRCHYRAVYNDVLTMCEELGVPVDRRSWFEAIARCVIHFSTIKRRTFNGGKMSKVKST
eukprot:scaffold1982_cov93-Amphora_coffeaeformis.AAC.9